MNNVYKRIEVLSYQFKPKSSPNDFYSTGVVDTEETAHGCIGNTDW